MQKTVRLPNEASTFAVVPRTCIRVPKPRELILEPYASMVFVGRVDRTPHRRTDRTQIEKIGRCAAVTGMLRKQRRAMRESPFVGFRSEFLAQTVRCNVFRPLETT
jgi:hypothetical protein